MLTLTVSVSYLEYRFGGSPRQTRRASRFLRESRYKAASRHYRYRFILLGPERSVREGRSGLIRRLAL